MLARSVPWVVLLLLRFHENSSRGTKYTAWNFLEGLFCFKTAFHIKMHELCTLDSSQGRSKYSMQPRLWYECRGEDPVSPVSTGWGCAGSSWLWKGLPARGWERGLSANTTTLCCFSVSSTCLKGISLEHQKLYTSV